MKDRRVSKKKKKLKSMAEQEVGHYKYGVPPEDLDPETTQMGGDLESAPPPESDEDLDDDQ